VCFVLNLSLYVDIPTTEDVKPEMEANDIAK